MLHPWLKAVVADFAVGKTVRPFFPLNSSRVNPRNLVWFLLLCVFWLVASDGFAQSTFANFESPHARSIAVSKTGERMFALNTPNHSLWVYSLEDPAKPLKMAEIPVGLEPVSLAVRSDNEVYVVNHLSDTVSVVDVDRQVVVDTFLVGKRPGDIILEGDLGEDEVKWAVVTSLAERSVWNFWLLSREDRRFGVRPGRATPSSVESQEPRTLLASSTGELWVATFRSGNRTTVVSHQLAPPPPAPTNPEIPPAPPQGILVDAEDPAWQERHNIQLSDRDLIGLSEISPSTACRSLGTVLFNMAENPADGSLWIANTEARNQVRFEPQLKGHVVDHRLTIVTPRPGRFPVDQSVAGARFQPLSPESPVVPPEIMDLNPGLDYDRLPNPEALETALAQPTDIVFDPHWDRAYVAAFGTDRIGVIQPSTRQVLSRIDLGTPGAFTEPRMKRGPRSLAIHPEGGYLYVLNRLSNSVSTVNLRRKEVAHETEMADPTPQAIREGRGYLFDAKLSGNGTVSCTSCHIDADRDGLAWDLGDPGGQMFSNGSAMPTHPMKGPLLTQTLKGMAGERIFHWRADRPGLESFNGTFADLLGGEELDEDDLETFVQYMKSIRFGPNNRPRSEDPESVKGQRRSEQVKRGEQIFKNQLAIGREGQNRFRCIDCHKNRSGSGSSGFTGLMGQSTKVAHLRGLQERSVFDKSGTRVSGFGYGADGSKASLIDFLADSHRFDGISNEEKIALREYLFAFPTETPSVVGMNVTVRRVNVKDERVARDLQEMMEGARLDQCQLVIHGLRGGKKFQSVLDPPNDVFRSDDQAEPPLTLAQILEQISQDEEDEEIVSFLALPRN